MRWPLAAAWTCAVAAAAAAAAVLVARSADADPASGLGPAVLLAAAVPALVAGVAIARVRSSGAIGPLLGLIGLMAAADAALTSWADAAGDLPGASLAALLYSYDWVPVFGAVAVLLMVFPDGHPPGPRWRWAVVVAVVAPALLLVAGLFRDAPLAAPYEDLPRPFPPAPFSDVLTAIALPLLAIALALAALAIVLRFRRSEGVERIQLKWLAGVAALIPGSFAVCLAAGLLSEDAEAVTAVAFGLMYVAVVGAVAVAMLRHGLFDVDRVISRAIAWGTLSLVLVGLLRHRGAGRGDTARWRVGRRHRPRGARGRRGVRPVAPPAAGARGPALRPRPVGGGAAG